MTLVIKALSSGGVVTAAPRIDTSNPEVANPTGPVSDVVTQNKLVRPSQGVLLVDDQGAHYIAVPTDDIAELLNLIKELLEVVKTVGESQVVGAVVGQATGTMMKLSELNPQIVAKAQQLETKTGAFVQT